MIYQQLDLVFDMVETDVSRGMCRICRCRVASNRSMKLPQVNRECCDCMSHKIIQLHHGCRHQNCID